MHEGPSLGSIATLPPDRKHCHACASVLDARAEVCPRCGLRQLSQAVVAYASPAHPVAPLPAPTRDKSVAGLLALLLGGFGVHKFYLGRTAAGVFYLLFCWTFVPAIIAFFEAISLLTMRDDAFARSYHD